MTDQAEVTLSGALPPGAFAFERARPSPSGRLDTTTYWLDGVTAHGVEFVLDEVRLHIRGSEFDNCVFRQDPRVIKANRNAFAHSYGFGTLGLEHRSVYRNCTFDHVDFGSRGGGYVLGDARFEGCTFRHCAFREFWADRADFIDCAFVGTITSACFHGYAEPPGDEPRHNSFSGNDLRRAKPRRVEFRGIDLRSSRLPDGPDYLRIDDFLAKAQKARALVAGWPEAERDKAEFLLRLYEERASEPFFKWRGAVAGRDSPVWPLLESL